MNEAELRELIERIVQAVLGEHSRSQQSQRPVLLLLTAAVHGHERALQFVASLAGKTAVKVHLAGCYTDRFSPDAVIKAAGSPDRVLTKLSPAQCDSLVDEAAAVVFLQPLRATIAKTARGMADSPPAMMLTRSLSLNTPTFCAGGETDPASFPATMPAAMRHGQGSLADWLDKDIKALESWGLTFRRDPLELESLVLEAAKGETTAAAAPPAPAVQKAPQTRRQFLTADDIRRVHSEGKRSISLGPNTLVTDEARDVAAALFVSFE